MVCDCLKNIEEQILNELDPKAEFEHDFMNSGNGLELRPSSFRFKYHKKKADGTFEKKISKSFVAFSYCPFCGKKYKDEINGEAWEGKSDE